MHPTLKVQIQVYGFDKEIDWSATDSRVYIIPQQIFSTLTIRLQDLLPPTKGTAPKSIMAWKIPTGLRQARPVELNTIEVDISTPLHFDDLNEDTQIARDAMQSDARRVDLVFHLAEGGWKGTPEDAHEGAHEGLHEGIDWNRIDRSVMQPNIRLLPDLRQDWGDEGWEKRAVVAKAGAYHLFYTLAKGGLLAPNKRTGWTTPQVHGDMFLLKVSEAEDDKGHRFYEDANPSLDELTRQDQFKDLDKFIYLGVLLEESDE